MLIARLKKKENIAEYIIYMWQVEDTLRACKFNMDLLEDKIISQFSENEKVRQEIRDWYADLIVLMHQEKIQETGHLSMLNEIVTELNEMHLDIIGKKKDAKYMEQYGWASPNIAEIEKKLGRKPINEIDTCLTALYALLLMRLKKKEITRETLEAMQTFSNLLAILSGWYKKIKSAETGD